MPKNILSILKETFLGNSKSTKIDDFRKAKEDLLSAKTKKELISAVKGINNFNKKYHITEDSPEFIYFNKMVLVMKLKIMGKKSGIDEQDGDGQRMSDEFDWLRNSFDFKIYGLGFNGFEYWIDIENLNIKDKKLILGYISEVVFLPKHMESFFKRGSEGVHKYKGIIIHCGSEDLDYIPQEGEICFMNVPFNDDEKSENSIYIDGTELVEYIKNVHNKEEDLEESMEWSDKDTNYETDKNFSADPNWKNDENWSINPDRSYWKQGTVGSTSGSDTSGDDVNESDKSFEWIVDIPDSFLLSDYMKLKNIKRGDINSLLGLKVSLSPHSRWYQDQIEEGYSDETNPIGLEGVILEMERNSPDLWIMVKWDNGWKNSYMEDDLLVLPNNNINESQDNDLEWIVNQGNPIPFEQVTLGVPYTATLTKDFFDALRDCGENIDNFLNTSYVIVIGKSYLNYGSVHCRSERDDVVISLLLDFFESDDYEIDSFWVTENMVILQ